MNDRKHDTNATFQVVSRTRITSVVLIACLLSYARAATADDWPRFRGPNGAGVSNAAIPAKWTDADYRWKVALPGDEGHGSPVVYKGKVYLNGASKDGAQRLIISIDAATGKTRWVKRFDAASHRKHKFNSFATSTPAVDAAGVYCAWGSTKRLTLVALDHEGNERWQRDLGPVKGGHAFGVSPIVYEDMVILPNDQDGDSSLIAVDKSTGKTRWRIPRKSLRLTYSTPVVYQPNGLPPVLVFTNWQHGITGVEPRTGKVVWELDVFGKPDKERAIGSPVVAGDIVIGTCGFVTKDKHVVALRPTGKSGAPMAETWRIEKAVPHVPTVLVLGDRAYLWSDPGIITCVEVKIGKTVWSGRAENDGGKFYGSPVAASGRIFCAADRGQIVVIEAGNTYKPLAVNDLGETCRSTPAIAGGDMFIRTAGHLICIRGTHAN